MLNVSDRPTMDTMAIERMTWSRNFAQSLLDGLSDRQLIARAGGAGNHALWIMGHYAVADDQIRCAMTGESPTLPKEYKKLFEGGSEPIDDVSAYPSRTELTGSMRASRERIIDWVKELDESEYSTPTPEAMAPFAPDAISVPFAISAHDLLHAGQLAAIRSTLGLPRLHA